MKNLRILGLVLLIIGWVVFFCKEYLIAIGFFGASVLLNLTLLVLDYINKYK